MFEHVHQLRWRSPALRPAREHRCDGSDFSRVVRRADSGSAAWAVRTLHEVIDEAHATAFVDWPHLVLAIGVERRVGQLRDLRCAEIHHSLASGVMDDELAAAMRRRQRHNQCGEHARCLLGVPVRDEEPAFFVHEKLVELPGDGALRRAEPLGHARHNRREGVSPILAPDPNRVGRQLPDLAHARVDDGVLTPPVRRSNGPADDLACLRGGNRKRHRAHAYNVESRHRRVERTGGIEIP